MLGLKIIENPLLTIGPFEDWSKVRSPSRAKRRRRQGHKQRIVVYREPDPQLYFNGDAVYAHPVTAQKLKTKLLELPSAREPQPWEPGDPIDLVERRVSPWPAPKLALVSNLTAADPWVRRNFGVID